MSDAPSTTRRRPRPVAMVSSCAILLIIVAGSAHADGLDGIWCSPDGRRITVDGLDVITPGGQRTTGVYGKQVFSFPVPENEPDAGSVIWMALVDENMARVSTVSKQQSEPPPHGRWRRCAYTSQLSPELKAPPDRAIFHATSAEG